MPDILDHEQAFSVQFSDHQLNTRQFYNQTQINHLNSNPHCMVLYLKIICKLKPFHVSWAESAVDLCLLEVVVRLHVMGAHHSLQIEKKIVIC